MEASMSEQLYNTRILRLAANIPHHGQLPVTDARVTRVSPICGSKITVDVVMDLERVAAFGQEVRACALGQASASILGEAVIGATLAELQAARIALAEFLAGSGEAPQGRFAALELFRPAIPHRGRHGSILLAFQAAEEAVRSATLARGALSEPVEGIISTEVTVRG